jgi:hypothetical protein
MPERVGAGGERLACQEAFGARVAEADGNAVHGRVGVEGQPGGSGLRDGDLADQEFGAAPHPQTDDVARPDAAGDQPTGDRIGTRRHLGVRQPLVAEDHGELGCVVARRGGEDLGQCLIAD